MACHQGLGSSRTCEPSGPGVTSTQGPWWLLVLVIGSPGLCPTRCPTLALTSLATVPALWSQETIPGSQLVSLPARPFPGFLALALPAWKGQDSGSVPALFLLCLPLWPGLSPCLGPQLEVSLPCFCALARDPFPAGTLVPPLGVHPGPTWTADVPAALAGSRSALSARPATAAAYVPGCGPHPARG